MLLPLLPAVLIIIGSLWMRSPCLTQPTVHDFLSALTAPFAPALPPPATVNASHVVINALNLTDFDNTTIMDAAFYSASITSSAFIDPDFQHATVELEWPEGCTGDCRRLVNALSWIPDLDLEVIKIVGAFCAVLYIVGTFVGATRVIRPYLKAKNNKDVKDLQARVDDAPRLDTTRRDGPPDPDGGLANASSMEPCSEAEGAEAGLPKGSDESPVNSAQPMEPCSEAEEAEFSLARYHLEQQLARSEQKLAEEQEKSVALARELEELRNAALSQHDEQAIDDQEPNVQQQAQNEAADLSARVAELAAELASDKEQISELNKIKTSFLQLKQDYSTLQSQLDSIQQTLTSSEEQQTRIDELEETLRKQQEQIDSEVAQRLTAEKSLEEKQQELERVTEDCQRQYDERETTFEKQFDDAGEIYKKQFDDAEAEYQRQLTEANDQVNDLKTRLNQASALWGGLDPETVARTFPDYNSFDKQDKGWQQVWKSAVNDWEAELRQKCGWDKPEIKLNSQETGVATKVLRQVFTRGYRDRHAPYPPSRDPKFPWIKGEALTEQMTLEEAMAGGNQMMERKPYSDGGGTQTST